jgi:hypothetical protein
METFPAWKMRINACLSFFFSQYWGLNSGLTPAKQSALPLELCLSPTPTLSYFLIFMLVYYIYIKWGFLLLLLDWGLNSGLCACKEGTLSTT